MYCTQLPTSFILSWISWSRLTPSTRVCLASNYGVVPWSDIGLGAATALRPQSASATLRYECIGGTTLCTVSYTVFSIWSEAETGIRILILKQRFACHCRSRLKFLALAA